MAAIVTLEWNITIEDATGLHVDEGGEVRFAPGAGTYGKRETVSLTGAAFNALTVPSGAKAVCIFPGTAPSLTLKGVTGDGTGVVATPASNALGIPIILPLGSSPSIGLYNGGSTVSVEMLWL